MKIYPRWFPLNPMGACYLEQQVISIESQTVAPDRIYIRDDGSSDGTADVIKRLASLYSNITYDFGSNVCWRLGFIEALSACGDYEWYVFCDQDDYWLPKKLEAALLALKLMPKGVPVVYAGNVTVTDGELNSSPLFNAEPVDIVNKDLPHNLTMDEMAGGLTYVLNNEAKRLLVSFEPRGLTGHDRLLMLICKLYGKITYDYNSYVLYRQHGSNAIGADVQAAPRT